MDLIRNWLNERFSDPQVVILTLLLAAGGALVLSLGGMLAPVFAGVVIAYLLEGLVRFLQGKGVDRKYAVPAVFSLFMLTVLVGLLGLLPLLTKQIGQLLNQLPSMIARGQEELLLLPQRYPSIFSEVQVTEVMNVVRAEVMGLGQKALTFSLASLKGVMSFLVYLILVPLLVFFFLKDKEAILAWVQGLLPENRALAVKVWGEVDQQIGNYIRGRVWEVLIVWAVCYAVFLFSGLQFALLLGFLVGLSVFIPYIGALVVTIPVALVAYYQWGWTAQMAYLMLAYGVILAIDANVLCPILLSGVVNLHPVAIIVAILFFGGLWGFWGIFFAIPLAALVNAVLRALPRQGRTVLPSESA